MDNGLGMKVGADADLLRMQAGVSLPGRETAADRLDGTLANLKKAKAKSRAEMHKVATDFESVFLSQMFDIMMQGIPTDGLTGGGNGEAIFRSQLNQEYAKSVAGRGGIGIADSVYRQMLLAQEGPRALDTDPAAAAKTGLRHRKLNSYLATLPAAVPVAAAPRSEGVRP